MFTKLLDIYKYISYIQLTHVFLVYILDNTTLYLYTHLIMQYGARQIAHTRSIYQHSVTGEWRSICLLFGPFVISVWLLLQGSPQSVK